MIPIYRALKDKLLNNPVFFLSGCAAVAVVLQQQVDLPGWVAPAAVLVFGLAQRATVDGPLTAEAKRKRAVRAARGASK